MAECKDCIHFCVCDRYTAPNESYPEVGGCKLFKSAADVIELPQSGIGDLSDGYHTFNELYHHRAILFSVICNLMPDKAWKSKLHDTGDMYDGMFIVGIETPQGQATYHYDIDPYWDIFKVKELEKAPKWDGHTPQDAIERISTLAADVVPMGAYKQILWERDQAMKQLEEYGIPFGGEVNVIKDRWINLEERKPIKSGSYLITTKNGAVCTAHWYEGSEKFSSPAGKNAEYWMPMPEPPTKEETRDGT